MADYYRDLKLRWYGQYQLRKKTEAAKTENKNKDNPDTDKIKANTPEGRMLRTVAIMNLTAKGRAKLKKSQKLFQKHGMFLDKLPANERDKEMEILQEWQIEQAKLQREHKKQKKRVQKQIAKEESTEECEPRTADDDIRDKLCNEILSYDQIVSMMNHNREKALKKEQENDLKFKKQEERLKK